jgi:phosphatidate phosphatase LPIN
MMFNVSRYITRSDGSPLLDALVLWRDALVKQTTDGIPLRPTSPTSSVPDTPVDEEEPDQRRDRAKSEPPEQAPTVAGKPTSSSWVQWWSRSKQQPAAVGKDDRPPLSWAASAPVRISWMSRAAVLTFLCATEYRRLQVTCPEKGFDGDSPC